MTYFSIKKTIRWSIDLLVEYVQALLLLGNKTVHKIKAQTFTQFVGTHLICLSLIVHYPASNLVILKDNGHCRLPMEFSLKDNSL